MMRIILPLAIALTLIFGYFSVTAKQQVSAALGAEIMDMLSGNVNYDGDSVDESAYDYEIEKSTHDIAVVTLAYCLLAEAALVFALLKIKTKTVKIISIIGIAVCGLFFAFNFMPLSSPGKAGFDEIWMWYYLFGVLMLTFFTILTIHIFRKKNQNNLTPGMAS